MSDILMIVGIVLIVVASHKQEKCKKPIFWRIGACAGIGHKEEKDNERNDYK